MKGPKDRVVRIGALELKFLVDENDAPGQMVMFEFVIPPGARVPVPHYHKDVDEAVYVLSGTMSTTRDGELHEIRPGESLYIPRGIVHGHENLGSVTVKSLIVMTPGSIGRAYFEEMAAALSGPAKPDPAKMRDIMERHGLIAA